jgi:hypothetical protein
MGSRKIDDLISISWKEGQLRLDRSRTDTFLFNSNEYNLRTLFVWLIEQRGEGEIWTE